MIEYMTYKQAMQYLGLNSYQSLNELIQEGLPTIVYGKSKRISKKAIDKFMNEHTVVANNEVD